MMSTHDVTASCDLLQSRYIRANAHSYTLSRLSEAIHDFCSNPNNLPNPQSSPNPSNHKPNLFAIVCAFHPVFQLAVTRAMHSFPPPTTFTRKVVFSWRNVLPNLDRLALRSKVNEDQDREARLARQRVGLLLFVNSYKINLDLIRSGYSSTLDGLCFGCICFAIESRE